MEIAIAAFIGIWICSASIAAYLWLKKEGENINDKETLQ